jgi:pimeloyl-ACP methyl ester carboxylesterase
MDAHRLWAVPRILEGLRRNGFTVLAPNRRRRPPNWEAEVEHLSADLPGHPVALIAGSNGCSAAVRLALQLPDRITRLLLAWPATAGDPIADARTAAGLTSLGASPAIVHALLDGQILRGTGDTEFAALRMPVSVLPSDPENLFHQRHTVDALRQLIPHSDELPGYPEPPHPTFGSRREAFLASVTRFASP